jgi:hypothetical protein
MIRSDEEHEGRQLTRAGRPSRRHAVAVAADGRRERVRGAVAGLALGVAVLVTNAVLFYFSLLFCRGENQQHYHSACPPVDHHPGALFEWGVLGVAFALPVLGWLGGPRSKWMLTFGGFAVSCWLVYFVSVLAT